MRIETGMLSDPRIGRLLSEHLEDMAERTPPEDVHALDLDGLSVPEITLFSAWIDEELLGCGALKELSRDHGEIKSMRTAEVHVRKGVAAAILAHIIAEARRRGYQQLFLETSSSPAFRPAHALYEKFGFSFCGPFGDYESGTSSRFMTLQL